jgi:hypothetical protein
MLAILLHPDYYEQQGKLNVSQNPLDFTVPSCRDSGCLPKAGNNRDQR